MKTNNIFRILTAMIIIVTSQFTAFAKQDISIVYNAVERNGVLVGQTLYKKEGESLAQMARYNYVYNQNNQIIENNISKWNNKTESWDKSISVQYRYDDQTISTKYYAWDNEKEEYIHIPKLNKEIKDRSL